MKATKLTFGFLVSLLAATVLVSFATGCTTVSRADSPYKYYVIDVNADEPDAYFETKNEALEYKRHFAENHDYVVVKINKQYKVYNMASPRIILDN